MGREVPCVSGDDVGESLTFKHVCSEEVTIKL